MIENDFLEGIMTEEELQQKRQEFRDSEVQRKINDLGEEVSGGPGGKKSISKTSTSKKRRSNKDIPTLGWTLIFTQLTGLVFFCSLFLLSYIPKTKYLVTKIMP